MSRTRKLYISELISRNKYNEDKYIVKYNDNSVKYNTRDEAIEILSKTELWNKQVKYWFKAREYIVIQL